MWFDGKRQPNTIYVASVSRGKDSTAMLEAIKLMGWPLDMIVSVDIWFDEDTPAELPPMVAFKDEWDKKCLENFGLPVTRLCATKRDKESSGSSPECFQKRETYTSIFYKWRTHRVKNEYSNRTQYNLADGERSIYGFPVRAGAWCNSELKTGAMSDSSIRRAAKANLRRAVLQLQSEKCENEEQRHLRIPDEMGTVVQHSTESSAAGKQKDTCGCFLQVQSEKRQKEEQRHLRISNDEGELVYGRTQERSITGIQNQSPFSDKPQNEGQKINIVHYIGIAADEPKRIAKHMPKKDMVMPLVQIGWEEDLCGLIATYLDMLAPTYTTSMRDGCWFCHNQGVGQLRNLRKNYPDLWKKLLKLDDDSPVTFHADGHTVHDFDRRFRLEDEKLIDPTKPFRWTMLEEELNLCLW